MIVKKYYSELIAIRNHCKGIYTLEFKSLEGKFKYQPGQFLHIALDPDYDGSGQWPDSRCFSIQSNHKEGTLKITYSVKGKFTKQMEQQLSTGSKVWLKLPYGDLFTQPHCKRNTIFISGGTGITPFLSLFNDSSFAEYANPILFAGFRSRNMNIYNTEIEIAKSINPNFTVIEVYQNEKGILDITKIHDVCKHFDSIFLSGPPAMIKLFKSKLIELSVSADKILSDDWE